MISKIMADDNPQRIAEVLASMDEGLKMLDKGMSPEEIINTFKKTPRTKQADGGLNYLMGM
jgi:predicted transglutaminase-like protease